ncbi:MAG: caspase family protein [Planctomycetes bacterium]|nr:caspase family protein [Planctomycetota bacterium]
MLRTIAVCLVVVLASCDQGPQQVAAGPPPPRKAESRVIAEQPAPVSDGTRSVGGASSEAIRPPAGENRTETNYALLIGIDKYNPGSGLAPLEYADDDVDQVRKRLWEHEDAADREFLRTNVVVLSTREFNAKNDSRRLPHRKNILEQLEQMAARAGPEDTLLLYYSGHGVQHEVDGKLQMCLLPGDANFKEKTNFITLDAIYALLNEKCRAKAVFFFCDACRNEPFTDDGRSVAGADEAGKRAVNLPTPPKQVLSLFSCGPGEKSEEPKDLEHGVFTYYLLKALTYDDNPADQNQDGVLNFHELYDYTRERVKKATGDRQNPDYDIRSEGGDFPPVVTVKPGIWLPDGYEPLAESDVIEFGGQKFHARIIHRLDKRTWVEFVFVAPPNSAFAPYYAMSEVVPKSVFQKFAQQAPWSASPRLDAWREKSSSLADSDTAVFIPGDVAYEFALWLGGSTADLPLAEHVVYALAHKNIVEAKVYSWTRTPRLGKLAPDGNPFAVANENSFVDCVRSSADRRPFTPVLPSEQVGVRPIIRIPLERR